MKPALIARFDAIVSADAFENLKPAPDIFLAASKILNVDPSEVICVIRHRKNKRLEPNLF